MISKIQIDEYLKTGHRCPRCGSTDIVGRSVKISEGTATQPVSCSDCDLNWEDIYTLSGILIEDGLGDNPWQECKSFPREDWKHLVGDGETNHGYWDYVTSMREQEDDEEEED